jgi:hypothetical protein
MVMTTATASDVQNDHKHWLRDLDRWGSYLKVWQNQIHEMRLEYRKVLTMVDQQADDLDDFRDTLEAHRNRLLIDERAMVEHHQPVERDARLAASHEDNASRHEKLYKTHERLKQLQHTLEAGLASLKHEPLRGE